MRYLLDTNVIMYAVGRPHRYREPCDRVLHGVFARSLDGCVDSELLQEILYRYAQIGQPQRAREIARDVLDLFETVLPVGRSEIELAIQLAERYPHLSPRDLVHAAVAIQNGIVELISTDSDFDEVAELRRIDPVDVVIENP